jgi:hypothetical protein
VHRFAVAVAVLVSPTLATAASPSEDVALSRVIYLNRHGVTVSPGTNDARINRSSVAKQPATIPAWNPPAEVWAETVTCLRTMFAPFTVEISEVDPETTPHIEAVFGGAPALLGVPSTVGGVAPLSKTCGVVENAMVYVFTDVLPSDALVVCETMAQEIAHAYGLDHALLPTDPMSYLASTRARRFQDVAAPCGETTARPCGLGPSPCRELQNSYAVLIERLGASGWMPPEETTDQATSPEATPADEVVGCDAGGGATSVIVGLGVLVDLLRRRKRAW